MAKTPVKYGIIHLVRKENFPEKKTFLPLDTHMQVNKYLA